MDNQAPPPPGYPTAPPPPVYQQPAYPGPPPVPVMEQPAPVQPPMVGAVMVSEGPMRMTCPHCGAHITTAVHYKPGLLTWLAAGALCVFGLWLGCCLIPFCIDSLKDVEHFCPNCQRLIGCKKRA